MAKATARTVQVELSRPMYYVRSCFNITSCNQGLTQRNIALCEQGNKLKMPCDIKDTVPLVQKRTCPTKRVEK